MSQYTNTDKTPEVPGRVSFDPHGGKMWNPPGTSVAGNVRQIGSQAGKQQVLVGAVGDWANYEVWADVPNSWQQLTCILRAQGPEGIWYELDRKRLIDMEHITITNTGEVTAGVDGIPTAPGRLQGLLFANYGRPPGAARLEVVALQDGTSRGTDGTTSNGGIGGRFGIRMWGTEGVNVGSRVGRPSVDSFAHRSQNVNASFTVPVGNTDVPWTGPGLISPPRNAAIHVTDLVLSNSVFGNTEVTLQQTEKVTATTIEAGRYNVSFGAIPMNYTIPITGRRGWTWQLLRVGATGNIRAQLNGYVA